MSKNPAAKSSGWDPGTGDSDSLLPADLRLMRLRWPRRTFCSMATAAARPLLPGAPTWGPHRRQRVKCGDCLVPPGELAKHGPQMVIPLALAGVLKASWVCMVEQTFDTSLACFRNLSKRSSGLTPVASAKMLTKSWGLEFQSRLLSGTLISDCE